MKFYSISQPAEIPLREFIANLPVAQARRNWWHSRRNPTRCFGPRIGREMDDSFYVCREMTLPPGSTAKFGCCRFRQTANRECSFMPPALPTTASSLRTVAGLPMSPGNLDAKRCTSCRLKAIRSRILHHSDRSRLQKDGRCPRTAEHFRDGATMAKSFSTLLRETSL